MNDNNEIFSKLVKVDNIKKKKFDHSSNLYYKISLSKDVELLFTPSEINKSYERYKRWINK